MQPALPDEWKFVPSDLTDPRWVTRVIDGDTLDVAPGGRVRLIGIDCPEMHEPLGPEVAAWVRQMVEGRRVRLSFDPATVISGHRDVFDRSLAYVWLRDGRLLNWELLLAGYATVDLRYPCLWTQTFLEAARAACTKRLGVWTPASPHRCVDRTRCR
jgi:micrococcal nuclease